MRKFITAILFLAFSTLASASEDLKLTNGKVSLTFGGGSNFEFKEFVTNGRNMLPKDGTTTHPWTITLKGPRGENPMLQPGFSYYDGGRIMQEGDISKAVFTWRIVLESQPVWKIKVTVSLSNDSELPEWTFSAELPKNWVITDLEFPRIAVDAPQGSKAIMPFSYGAEYDLATNGHLRMDYPSVMGTMELVMVHRDEKTTYFAAMDKSGARKSMSVQSTGSNVIFTQKVIASYAWTSGGCFNLPWATVLGFNDQSWEETAVKWYRPFLLSTEWGSKTLEDRPIADWIKNADIWLRPADATPRMIEDTRKALEYYGKGVGLHWYYWHNHPFDTFYPEYFPEQPGFKEMIKECQKMGAHVTPYINGRLWDCATESYKTLNGKDASCRKPDGSLYTEVYSSKVLNTVTCPSSEIWQNVLRNLNARILEELDTDGVYMDQIGCAIGEPCYNPDHPHAMGGGSWWVESYRDLLLGMRKDIYTKNKAMTTEENAECYIDLFDMMLVVNSPHQSFMKMVPLFPILYSDKCIYSGFTYIPWKLNDGSMNYITMKSLLWGAQLGWVNPSLLMAPDNAAEAAFLKNMGAFRKKSHDIFLGGRFIKEFVPEGDNEIRSIPGFCDSPVVLGAVWTDRKGKAASILVNMSGKDRKVINHDGRKVTVKAFGAVRL
jgi:hypothetical protein